MEENLLPVQPLFKLYKDRAIYIGTFIGGPLVAGYLAAENFRQLGETNKIKTTWIVSILATIAIFGGVFLIPNIQKVPSYIIPIAYTILAQYLVKKYQGQAIKEHIETGGETFSTWRAVWIGLIGLTVLLGVLIVITIVTYPEILK